MKIVRTLDEHAWRDFVAGQPAGNVFHTPELYRVFARTPGFEPALWAVQSGGGDILALLLPVRITLLEGVMSRLSTRTVVFGGILADDTPRGQDALDLLLGAYVREPDGAPLFTELRNLSATASFQPILSRHRFHYEDHLNFLIDLRRSPDDLLQSIGQRTRKIIRRGIRAGRVTVTEVIGPEGLAACYAILAGTYQAARVPLAPFPLFQAAHELLLPRGMARFSLACIDGTPVATSIDLPYKETVYGWYGGVVRSHNGSAPNELLTWDVLSWSTANGYAVYDFGGAGRPDEQYGVRDFKAKFGGTLVNFGRNTHVHAPFLLRLSRWGYRLMRRRLSRTEAPQEHTGRQT